MAALIVFSTFPDAETALRIGRTLVEERCAACVNLLPGVESVYWWRGGVETGTEVLAIFKTNEAGYPKLQSRLKELHPYELPEIVAVQPWGGLPSYLQWVLRENA
ncbi:MAG: divalent-cation tolerance protein CutA [Verrucomicrobiota bacterium]